MKGGFYTHRRQMAAEITCGRWRNHDRKQKMQFALRRLASGIKMTILLPAPPATKLKPVILPESGHLGRTTFFACNHNGVGPTTRSRQTHACRSNQTLCPMPSALHADLCSGHKRYGCPSQAVQEALRAPGREHGEASAEEA